MAIAAHPDDIEFWCAGTLIRTIAAGAAVRLLLVTSGDKGSSDPAAIPRDLARQREAEAAAAADLLGFKDVAFLRYPDGEVENTHALRGDLVSWIRRWAPAVLFTHDPEHSLPAYLSHRDHRVVGRAALDAVYPLARDRLNFPEHEAAGLKPHAVGDVWLFASSVADSFVDISESIQHKIAARLKHVSQTSDPVALRESWTERANEIGVAFGVPAEGFTELRHD
jgi:LmbE family N-acetylglucosaminyl deacetylase